MFASQAMGFHPYRYVLIMFVDPLANVILHPEDLAIPLRHQARV